MDEIKQQNPFKLFGTFFKKKENDGYIRRVDKILPKKDPQEK